MSSFQKHISLFDKSFSDLKTKDYQLFLQLGKQGLSYTVFNTPTNTFIGIESYLFNNVYNDYSILNPLNELFEILPLLNQPFNKFVVTYVNNRSTLIPKPLFQKDDLTKYHQFNFSSQDEDVIQADFILNLSAYNIYSMPDYIINRFNKIHHVTFHHFSTALIEAALLNAKKSSSKWVVDVNILPNSFQVLALLNQKLELYNNFQYQTSEDFIYYLLFTLNQLNINNEEIMIRLTGEVDKNSAIYDMLQKYIHKIELCTNPNELNYSYIFEETPKHYHYALFNQYLCE